MVATAPEASALATEAATRASVSVTDSSRMLEFAQRLCVDLSRELHDVAHGAGIGERRSDAVRACHDPLNGAGKSGRPISGLGDAPTKDESLRRGVGCLLEDPVHGESGRKTCDEARKDDQPPDSEDALRRFTDFHPWLLCDPYRTVDVVQLTLYKARIARIGTADEPTLTRLR